MEQVDRGQPAKELRVGEVAGAEVVGLPDPGQELGQRVDRRRVPGLHRELRDEHRERRLAGPDVAHQPQATSAREPRVEVGDELANVGDDRARSRIALHLGDRRAVEADALVLAGQGRAHSPRPRLLDPPRPALARAGDVLGVDDPPASVAGPERARRLQPLDLAGQPSAMSISGESSALGRRRGRHQTAVVVGEVGEGGELLLEHEPHGVDRAVAVLAHDQLGDPLQLRLLGRIDLVVAEVAVVVLAVDEPDQVGVLLEVARLAQVGEDRPLVAPGALLGRARELREGDHRHLQLAGEDLQPAAHLADLLDPAGAVVLGPHQLDVVDHDQRQAAVAGAALLRVQAPRLRPQVEHPEVRRLVDPQRRGLDLVADLEHLGPVALADLALAQLVARDPGPLGDQALGQLGVRHLEREEGDRPAAP